MSGSVFPARFPPFHRLAVGVEAHKHVFLLVAPLGRRVRVVFVLLDALGKAAVGTEVSLRGGEQRGGSLVLLMAHVYMGSERDTTYEWVWGCVCTCALMLLCRYVVNKLLHCCLGGWFAKYPTNQKHHLATAAMCIKVAMFEMYCFICCISQNISS